MAEKLKEEDRRPDGAKTNEGDALGARVASWGSNFSCIDQGTAGS
jgi:hypothetical protein